MSRKAFIHINGVTYESASPIDGDESDGTFQRLEQQLATLASGTGGGQVTLDVLIDGNPAKLHTTPQGVFAAAAFLARKRGAAAAFV